MSGQQGTGLCEFDLHENCTLGFWDLHLGKGQTARLAGAELTTGAHSILQHTGLKPQPSDERNGPLIYRHLKLLSTCIEVVVPHPPGKERGKG